MTVQLVGEVFPWLAHSVNFSETECSISHLNQSPENPCAAEDLPPHPDDHTRKLIEKYNHLDIEVVRLGFLLTAFTHTHLYFFTLGAALYPANPSVNPLFTHPFGPSYAHVHVTSPPCAQLYKAAQQRFARQRKIFELKQKRTVSRST